VFMNLEFIKNRNELISKALLAVSAVLCFCILIKVTFFFVTKVKAGILVNRAFAQDKTDANDLDKYFAKSKTLADEVKKKNMFAPPPPKKHPASQVSGILGSEVLINGKWYKVGDKVGDAKILAIEPTQVKIEWDGKEKYFAPIVAASVPPDNKETKKPIAGEKKKRRPRRKGRRGRRRRPQSEAVNAPTENDSLAWLGVKLSPEMREKFLERWNQLSDDEKEQAKDQWSDMSEDQKQQAVDAWD